MLATSCKVSQESSPASASCWQKHDDRKRKRMGGILYSADYPTVESRSLRKKQKGRRVSFVGDCKDFDGLCPSNYFFDTLVWEGFCTQLVFPAQTVLYSNDPPRKRTVLESFLTVEDGNLEDGCQWPPRHRPHVDMHVQVDVNNITFGDRVLQLLQRFSELFYERRNIFVYVVSDSASETAPSSMSSSPSLEGSDDDVSEASMLSAADVTSHSVGNDEESKRHAWMTRNSGGSAGTVRDFCRAMETVRASMKMLLERVAQTDDMDLCPILPGGGGSSAKISLEHIPVLEALSGLFDSASHVLARAEVNSSKGCDHVQMHSRAGERAEKSEVTAKSFE